jgi:hypothetical protein
LNGLTLRHAHTVPAILANAGENAATKFLEFFAARIRNLNTREAYARACAQFLAWSEQHLDDIRLITPMHVAAYIEQHPGSPQTMVKFQQRYAKRHGGLPNLFFAKGLCLRGVPPIIGTIQAANFGASFPLNPAACRRRNRTRSSVQDCTGMRSLPKRKLQDFRLLWAAFEHRESPA